MRTLVSSSTLAYGAVLLLLATGCATASRPHIDELAKAAEATRDQTKITYAAVNAMIQADQIDDAVHAKILNEDSVAAVLPAADIQKRTDTLDEIHLYLEKLLVLTSPDIPDDFENSMVELATSWQALREDDQKLPPGVATGFGKVGALLIEAKANRDALKVARKVDPAIHELLVIVADDIGETPQDGIRGTVRTHWLDRMATVSDSFLKPNAPRHDLVLKYLELRDLRDAQDDSLASLRRSILEFATAHERMARGESMGLTGALARIQGELDSATALYERFKAIGSEK